MAARPGADKNSYYDELVIRWNDIPRDTLVNVYRPDWNADEILALAAALRPEPQRLSKVDLHTIACSVGEITYIPISAHQQPALLTLQLPLTVRDGEKFRVDVEQHSGLTYQTTLPNRQVAKRAPSFSCVWIIWNLLAGFSSAAIGSGRQRAKSCGPFADSRTRRGMRDVHIGIIVSAHWSFIVPGFSVFTVTPNGVHISH